MKSGLSDTNPIIVAAFKAALVHQGLLILIVLALLALAWTAARMRWIPWHATAHFGPSGAGPSPTRTVPPGQSTARRVLRVGFGILWVFDGLLQAQPAMAAGLPSQVIQPAAATSPSWVQHLVNWGATAWS